MNNKYLEAYKEANKLTPKDFLLAKVRKANKLIKQACEKAKKYDDMKTPIKPIKVVEPKYSLKYPRTHYECTCGNTVDSFNHRYCNRCGNKIDWSDK